MSARTTTAPSSLHTTPAQARMANSVGRRKAETKDEGRRMKDEVKPPRCTHSAFRLPRSAARIRRAMNSPIRRAENDKNRENGIRRATNPGIRRADRGRIRQKWAVCAMHATNRRIRCMGLGKNRENAPCDATNLGIRRAEKGKKRKNGIRRATNPGIRRADRGRIRQKWAVCAMHATNRRILCTAWVKNGQDALWLADNPAVRCSHVILSGASIR
jgi:hypothetical protein